MFEQLFCTGKINIIHKLFLYHQQPIQFFYSNVAAYK
jgi:hypothetical protein